MVDKVKTKVKAKAKAPIKKPAITQPEFKVPEGWLVAKSQAYIVDPFEGTEFVEGISTPTPKSSWLTCQLEAGILTEV